MRFRTLPPGASGDVCGVFARLAACKSCGMPKCVVALTGAAIDAGILTRAARFFGWEALEIDRLVDLRAFDPQRIAALLFDRQAVGGSWFDAVSWIRKAAPESRLIACYGFSETIDWPALADAGVFHAIALPLSESELRQSLGYVWSRDEHARDEHARAGRPRISRVAA